MLRFFQDMRVLNPFDMEELVITGQGQASIHCIINRCWMEYQSSTQVTHFMDGNPCASSLRLRYDPKDLREIHLFTRRNNDFICSMYRISKSKIVWDAHEMELWPANQASPIPGESINSVLFLVGERLYVKSASQCGKKKYGPHRMSIEIETTSYYLKNYYSQVYRWSHRSINSGEQLARDKEVGAETLAIVDACFILRFKKGYFYQNIYSAIVKELEAKAIEIDENLLDVQNLQCFRASLQSHKITDFGNPKYNPGQLKMGGVKYARKLLRRESASDEIV